MDSNLHISVSGCKKLANFLFLNLWLNRNIEEEFYLLPNKTEQFWEKVARICMDNVGEKLQVAIQTQSRKGPIIQVVKGGH